MTAFIHNRSNLIYIMLFLHSLKSEPSFCRRELRGPPSTTAETAYATLHHARNLGQRVPHWELCSSHYSSCPVPHHEKVLQHLMITAAANGSSLTPS